MAHSFEFSLNTHRTHIGNCYDLYVIHSSHILHSFYACFLRFVLNLTTMIVTVMFRYGVNKILKYLT